MKHEVIGQNTPQYISNRGVCVADRKRAVKNADVQIKVIHIIPDMTEAERASAKKRIGNDLYEVFSRIKMQLKI